MWLSRTAVESLNAERIKALEEARVLFEQNKAQAITMDWMRMRLEQIERERAMLLERYMGIVVQVPHFVTPETPPEDSLAGANVWNDIGDEEAKRRKIDWDEHGVVKQ